MQKFHSNCIAIGIPCFTLSKELIKNIQNNNFNNSIFEIDLYKSTLQCGDFNQNLVIKNSSKKMFISGEWDATSTLLENLDLIEKKLMNCPTQSLVNIRNSYSKPYKAKFIPPALLCG